MHPVERMRSVVRAFQSRTSCVYVEPVKRTTYVAFWHNGKFFLAPTVLSLDHILLVVVTLFQEEDGHTVDCTTNYTHAHTHTHTHTQKVYKLGRSYRFQEGEKKR